MGNPGARRLWRAVRPRLSPADLVYLLGEVGAYGVNFHDNDLIPIDATPAERDSILKAFKKALADTGLVVPMATTNLFGDPAFKDGAFTSNDPKVRAYALQKTMNAMDLGVELGAKIYVFWGGREGVETDAAKDPVEAIKRFREAHELPVRVRPWTRATTCKFALEAKPNEPRGDIYFPTTGAYLGFIETLDHPEMVGVNPEVAHEHMAGPELHARRGPGLGGGQALPHRPQRPGLSPASTRTGALARRTSSRPSSWSSSWRTWATTAAATSTPTPTAPRTIEGVKDFARGCMRTYLILKEKARAVQRGRRDPGPAGRDQRRRRLDGRVQGRVYCRKRPPPSRPTPSTAWPWAQRGMKYEKLDQLVNELLLGVR